MPSFAGSICQAKSRATFICHTADHLGSHRRPSLPGRSPSGQAEQNGTYRSQHLDTSHDRYQQFLVTSTSVRVPPNGALAMLSEPIAAALSSTIEA